MWEADLFIGDRNEVEGGGPPTGPKRFCVLIRWLQFESGYGGMNLGVLGVDPFW